MNYGRYEVENGEGSLLGKGAMGVVYRALDPRLNRQVAIKVLHKKLLFDDEAVKGFLKEATLNASLSHPNILTILDVGEERGEVYIAMELLEGKPLSKRVSALEKSQIVSIGMQIADALDYAHKKGVVHRDIKPANIMVDQAGQIKITDFGIAKAMGAGDDNLQTQTGVIKGTPAYMSPEQASGDSKNVDGRSDLFSLGVILYELSVGKRPFGGDGKDFMAVFGEILSKVPVEPCKANESVDRELSAVIMKALQKDPVKRFQSGRELAEALKGCERGAELSSAERGSKRGVAIGASAAGVAVLCAAGFFLLHSGKKDAPIPKGGEVVSSALPAASGTPPQPPYAAPGATSSRPVPAPSTSGGLHMPTATNPQVPAPAPAAQAPPEPPPAVREEPKKKLAEKAKPARKVAEKERAPAKRERRHPSSESDSARSEAPATGGLAANPSEYAFLKVGSQPSGAQVYVNGSLKGMTPLKLRLNLGRYKVRLARSGYKSVSTSVTLDKMAEFPISEELKPE